MGEKVECGVDMPYGWAPPDKICIQWLLFKLLKV